VPDYNETSELLLDECIQALLDGQDWHSVTHEAAAAPEDVAPLVAIGQWLLQLARNVPPASQEGRTRIWRRVTESIDMSRLAARVLPAHGSNHAPLPGAAAYR
jgi:hypothetical protein